MTTWDDKLLTNPHAVADKRRRVQKMFAAIAPSYDLNNRLPFVMAGPALAKKGGDASQLSGDDNVVDVACGTGDLAIRFRDQLLRLGTKRFQNVVGLDFTYEMLPLARRKGACILPPEVVDPTAAHPPEVDGITWVNGDAQALPLPDASADVVSIAFGIRNVQHVPTALNEFFRVLRPGGRVIVLEFSLPTNRLLRALYNFYFRQILPRTATLISGDKTGAYKYLPESVNTFIGRPEMVQMLHAAGFDDVQQFPMTFGVCVCYRGIKAGSGQQAAGSER